MSNSTEPRLTDPLQPYLDDPFILPADVQKIIPNLTPRALANMRSRREADDQPRFYRVLGRVLYRRSDLFDWLEEQTHTSSRGQGEAA
ncbi:hypothetical protein [Corynebacterium comes]|uniref:DNA-binding protein n=1 Tax=Corynebacterium comes TaxID=2675218 RepID=A0A6B8VPX9_9CORY|nr:hypothetical protein [Corynebacterium comes]QGU05109.1 hypothetical protein CETAM_09280 [Corynebacterium comes]